MWCALIEKAYAKHFGTYQQLIGGETRDALTDLTGGISKLLEIDPKEHTVELWETLMDYQKKKCYLMGCSMMDKGAEETEDNFNGLIQKHAYGILKVVEYKGNKLLKLRNPWGNFEWRGDWCDSDKNWTLEMKKELEHINEDDGTFWMSFKDFYYNFTHLDVVFVFDQSEENWKHKIFVDEWDEETDGGDFTNANQAKTNITNPQYFLTLESNCTVFISMLQHDYRFFADYKNKPNNISFTVIKSDGSTRLMNCKWDNIVRKASVQLSSYREHSNECEMKKGKYFIVFNTDEPVIDSPSYH
jgi:hypothetical protein